MRQLMQRFIALLFVLAFICPKAFSAADDIARLYNFQPSTTIQSSQVNGEFNQLITTMNAKFGRGVDNTLSGNNTFSGANTFSGTAVFSNGTTSLTADKILEYTVGNGTLLNSVLLKGGYIKLAPTTQPYVPAANGEFGIDTTNNLYMGRINGVNVPFATDNGVNAQVGTSYTVLTSDRNKTVTLSNASAVAVTLPQAGSTGFASNWKATFVNLGAGTVTITPTTSTIDGAATITLTQNQGIQVFSDGTNYETNRGKSSTVAYSKSFLSSGQTITTAGALTIAHGLGGVPTLAPFMYLKCTTAELGYSIGDTVAVAFTSMYDTASHHGVSIKFDATNLTIRYGNSTILIPHATTGNASSITNGNWQAYFGAAL